MYRRSFVDIVKFFTLTSRHGIQGYCIASLNDMAVSHRGPFYTGIQ